MTKEDGEEKLENSSDVMFEKAWAEMEEKIDFLFHCWLETQMIKNGDCGTNNVDFLFL